MRKLTLLVVIVPCLSFLVGCPKKPGAGDGGDDATTDATVEVAEAAAPAPNAKNAAEVARFPAEKPVADDDEKTVDAFTQAKSGPKSGTNVALLKAGTDTFKIAEFQDCFLVTFADPKDAAITLMGWIPKAAFTADAVVVGDAGAKDAGKDAAAVDAGTVDAGNKFAIIKCAAGQEGVVNIGAVGAVCRKKCAADKDCKTVAAGACAPATTQIGKITKVCVKEAP